MYISIEPKLLLIKSRFWLHISQSLFLNRFPSLTSGQEVLAFLRSYLLLRAGELGRKLLLICVARISNIFQAAFWVMLRAVNDGARFGAVAAQPD